MVDRREGEIVEAFVRLANMLAGGHDVVELLDTLTTECVHLLDVASAGLLLADENGDLRVMAASSPEARQVEHFQVQSHEGPCRDCFLTGEPVSVPDLRTESERWPTFSRGALEAGFRSVHAVPMRMREQTLGALGLFGGAVGDLDARDLELGQALANVASVALVQHAAAADRASVAENLQDALSKRVSIEQAKGILAQHGELEMDGALAALRRYAASRQISLSAAAALVASRVVTASAVFERIRDRPAGTDGPPADRPLD